MWLPSLGDWAVRYFKYYNLTPVSPSYFIEEMVGHKDKEQGFAVRQTWVWGSAKPPIGFMTKRKLLTVSHKRPVTILLT